MATITPLKTSAEQALFGQAATLPLVRKTAFEKFEQSGLPHRRVEAYHYTDLRALLKDAPPPALAGARVSTPSPFAALTMTVLTLVDGRLDLGQSSEMPAGITVTESADIPDDGTEAASVLSSDPMIALNAAFADRPLKITIAAEAHLELPLCLRLVITGSHSVYPRISIEIGENVKATIIESHEGAASGALINSVVEMRVADHVTLDHIRVNLVDSSATLLTSFGGSLGQECVYRGSNFVIGGHLSRHQIFLRFEGEGSNAQLSGAALLNERQHADTTLVVDHAVPNCQSRELFAHVLDGESTGVFQGKIVVRPGAQQTDGKMMSRAIVLADGATMNNKPELEIFADDVACGHGATVGALDDDLLFYLRARGLPKREAEALMLQAFVGEVLEGIADDGLREHLETLTENWLKTRA
jgi:Fe-S cluster assembly protein SufD